MSFFKKLTTLVQSQVNDLLDTDSDEVASRARRKFLSRQDIGDDLQKDAKMLRQRINDALAYQDQMQAKIDGLYDTVAEWDQKADDAVNGGRETDARFALGRMQQAQRELEIAESALREHQLVTQELISQVNNLEAVLDQAKREQNQTPDDSYVVNVTVADDEGDDDESIASVITQKIEDTRRSIGQLVASQTAPTLPDDMDIVDEVPQPPAHPIDNRKVDDDLVARRNRLSGPPKNIDDKK